jgi:hypothetical protein
LTWQNEYKRTSSQRIDPFEEQPPDCSQHRHRNGSVLLRAATPVTLDVPYHKFALNGAGIVENNRL